MIVNTFCVCDVLNIFVGALNIFAVMSSLMRPLRFGGQGEICKVDRQRPGLYLTYQYLASRGGGWTFRNIYIDCEATAITEYSGFGGKCFEIHKILDYLKHLEKLLSQG